MLEELAVVGHKLWKFQMEVDDDPEMSRAAKSHFVRKLEGCLQKWQNMKWL